ncbi:hypothetical protein FA15DRAFT_602757 [Coprinopsis marcescibilis]|uniref:DUF6570 domain-containing protein n=1 Tax=Coprinopsis marcescibilis TaxID=230819 RepID=A0A5C3KF80_COPMA|nr:hypothetical protein FA15DRAFT_602757 [Coprinopsis marcescibilis]
MLDRRGFVSLESETVDLAVCRACLSSLRRSAMPQFALANNLFCGELPTEFADLTWIEEMACAVYRNTAHVTRLYNSSSPEQPTVLHGNTCVHKMNIISTARTLPHTPADINGMLSIVFVGPGKFDPKKSGDIFLVRKQKIWNFLLWLRENNRIYSALTLDKQVVDAYPDDGPLPGIQEIVVNNEKSSSGA